MGGRLALPTADDNMKKCIKTHMMKPKEVSKFWKEFRKLDKAKTGVIKAIDFFESIEETKNFFTDQILECFDITLDENDCMNFSDYLCLIVNYCMFEPPEIKKLCFYVFDEDKGGIVDAEELKSLMNTLYNIKEPMKVKGNPKASWKKLEFDEDLKVDFEQFDSMNRSYPWLFLPAFRLQNNMMINIFGELWWSNRKRRIQNFKDKLNRAFEKKQKKKEKKKKMAAQRHIRRRMGLIRFVMCPCLRYLYDDRKVGLTEEEKRERERQIAAARRAADLAAKNPVTHPWKKFEAKIKADKEREIAASLEHDRLKEEAELKKRGGLHMNSTALANVALGSTTTITTTGDDSGVIKDGTIVPYEEKKEGVGNPSTLSMNKKDKVPESPSPDGLLAKRLKKQERSRDERKDDRRARRHRRNHDDDLKFKPATVYG